MTTEIRSDRATLGRIVRTDEGYLTGEAIVTRTGVFEYLNADGSIRRELRHPDDVMEAESLATLQLLPVTVDHPTGEVTSQNAAELSVGTTGERYSVDGGMVLCSLRITHQRGVNAADNGKRELSLGYRTDVLPEQGEYNGIRYDHRQTKIRYNHLALVDKARAGESAKLNMDGIAVQSTQPQEANAMTVKVNLDGITYDAAPEVAKALERANERADASQKEYKDAKSKVDALQAQLDEAKAALDAMKKERDDAADALPERVQAKVALMADAGLVLDSVDVKMSDRDLMLAVIGARHDGLDLSDRSDEYIAARYDAVMDTVKAEKAGEANRLTADGLDPEKTKAVPSSRGDSKTLDFLVKRSQTGLED